MKSNFDLALPVELKDIFERLEGHDIECALVGGVVRDYFLGCPLKPDFDVEVRGDFSVLKTLLPADAIELKYKVFKLSRADFEAEFSLPRIEKFKNSLGFSHSNFTAEFDKNLSYKKAAKRRDFSINSIYAVYKKGKFEIEDPLRGLEDLKNRRLKSCSKNFEKDPVRFLRAIRFSILLGFDLDFELRLKGKIVEPKYILSEAEKSENSLLFLQKTLELHQEPIAVEVEAMYSYGFRLNHLKEIKKYWFMSRELKEKITELTGIKTKGKKSSFAIEVKRLKPTLLTHDVLNFLEQLAQCNEFEYEFLRYQQRVDLNWDTWRKLNEISVDYKDIEPSQRQIYKWTQILKSKF